jgi:FkbM family methyltransferase
MNGTLRRARRKAGAIRRRLFEPPESAAWRRAWHLAETTPRFTPGRIRMMRYDLQYSDLLSFCPQWEDIFVKNALAFRAPTDAPRILDCGANIGIATLYFKRAYPGARITAVEADPALFAMLDDNLARNGAADVERIHAALWTSTGTLVFQCEGSDSGMVSTLPGAVRGRSTVVPSRRLRELLDAEPFDLLKLDIEGAEGVVLADCADVLRRARAIVLDLHEFDPDVRQAPRVLDLLTGAGFEYAVDDLVTLPWRRAAAADAPFPNRAPTWAMTVRAWQSRS